MSHVLFARRVALALAALTIPVALSGCLFIGNRGGLDDKEKASLSTTKGRIDDLEERISALEMKAGTASPSELQVKLEQLQEENRRLSDELAKTKRTESSENK